MLEDIVIVRVPPVQILGPCRPLPMRSTPLMTSVIMLL